MIYSSSPLPTAAKTQVADTTVGPNASIGITLLESKPDAAPLMSLDGAPVECFGGRWHVAILKTREECAFGEDCQRRGIPYFLPLRKVRCPYETARGKVRYTVRWQALFPSYGFVCCDGDEIYQAQRCRSFRQFLSHTLQPDPHSALSAAIQSQLRTELMWLARGAVDGNAGETIEIPKIGQRVKVLSGAMEGFEGPVREYDDKMQLVVIVNFFNRAVPLHVDPYNVELI
jgi:transcription antitermination factor NusG